VLAPGDAEKGHAGGTHSARQGGFYARREGLEALRLQMRRGSLLGSHVWACRCAGWRLRAAWCSSAV
jgi:hypothetical protein